MSYNTDYSLDIIGTLDNGEKEEIINNLRSVSEDAEYAINENGSRENSCSWYEHEYELREFSKKYPLFVFELSGEGEESGDIWKKYFKNGKMQTCKAIMTFDEYDENKLI